ncbi:acetyl-CoA carboxylase biotin carboxyl carrier protein subunit [Oceanobacillus caeni]|uniref:acetyl-CoA carboxylase biotin carboxyl carrier protein subunit n=1 Tax=Oceanobacillus caeni TaxID=405946 RepID=UPI00214A568D|nr:acetyl-CoA carboxylase biotin carboxyl carrier protein subunit [Oceanobacillus caeni]
MHELKAMMAGSVWEVYVKVGDKVEEGQDVVILESMKMEIPIASDVSGTVKEVRVSKDDFVNEDNVLVVLE